VLQAFATSYLQPTCRRQQNLEDTALPKATRMESIRTFLVDLDGTMYLGSRLLPGAKAFFAAAEQAGRRVVFLSNNSSRSGAAYAARLRRMGVPARRGQVFTSADATAMYLASAVPSRQLYVIGTRSLRAELGRAGFAVDAEQPSCVVLGFDLTLSYAKVRRGCDLIRAGAQFVATHPDVNCPIDGGWLPDCGAMIEMFAAATGVRPKVVGKPQREMIRFALRYAHARPSEAAMVGDRLNTDVLMGRRAGMTTILVMSGGTTAAELRRSQIKPDLVFPSLKELAVALGAKSPTPPADPPRKRKRP